MATPLPITNGFYVSKSLPISHQECTNWYPSQVEVLGLSAEVLLGIPGITELATTGIIQQINRGAHVKNGIPYFVNGDALYKLNRSIAAGVESFSTTTLGTITGSGRVSMADNGTQLMILVPGGNGYIYNEDAGTPFAQITDVDFTANGNPQHVRFIDGYFAVSTDSKKWIISALNDGLAWSALDFGTAESDPDVIVAPVVVKNQIFITGSETTEGFQNLVSTGFPFQRNNIFLDKGCFAPFSLVKSSGTFFMVGGGTDEGPAVWQFTGNNFQKISTTPIDTILAGYSDAELGTAFGWSYAQDGAYFVGFSLPDRSFVFDLTTQKWHERKSQVNEATTRWRVNSIVTAYGRLLVGDAVDGRIGELDTDVYTEYGENIIRIVSTQPFTNQGNGIRVPILELTMEAGVGNSDVPDPVISLAFSKNGKTFGYERTRKIGKIGESTRRVFWRKNGRFARFVVARFRLSDAVKPVIIKLEAA